MKTHKPKKKVIKFTKKKIIPTKTLFEQTFGIPLTRDFYFGFDFECMLVPMNEKLSTSVGHTEDMELE